MQLIKKKFLNIPLPIYEGNLVVGYNMEIKEIVRNMKSKKIIEGDKQAEEIIKVFDDVKYSYHGLCFQNGRQGIIIVNEQDSFEEFVNTLTHEILHYVIGVLDHIKVKLGKKSEEAYTYLYGYLCGKVMSQLMIEEEKPIKLNDDSTRSKRNNRQSKNNKNQSDNPTDRTEGKGRIR